QTRYSNSTRIRCFSWSIQDSRLFEHVDSFRGRRHVSTLCYAEAAVIYQGLSIYTIKFVLSSVRECDIAFYVPWFLSLKEFASVLKSVFSDPASSYIF